MAEQQSSDERSTDTCVNQKSSAELFFPLAATASLCLCRDPCKYLENVFDSFQEQASYSRRLDGHPLSLQLRTDTLIATLNCSSELPLEGKVPP